MLGYPKIHALMAVVVQEQDVDPVTRALEKIPVPVVRFASVGGFLGQQNFTLLIGLPDERDDEVLQVLRTTCRQRVEYLAMPLEGAPMPMPSPVPVTVGGATIFTLPVERFEEI